MTQARIANIALLGGPLLSLVLYFCLPAHYIDSTGAVVEFGSSARAVVGLTVWMALWWLTEAAPLPVTSLLPATILPCAGVASFERVVQPYADPLIFLFLGGVILSIAIQKWELHRRFAYSLLSWTAGSPRRIVAGVLGATGFLSLWLLNTATAILILPFTWWLLTRVRFPLAASGRLSLPSGGDYTLAWTRLSRGARFTLVVFLSAALLWTTRPWLVRIAIGDSHPFAALTDPGIAMLAAAAPALGLTPTTAALVTALAASSAFMLPVGTAPTVLVFGTGHLSAADMAKAGFVLNLVSIILIVLVGTAVLPALFG